MKKRIMILVSLTVVLSVFFSSCARINMDNTQSSEIESNMASDTESDTEYKPTAIYGFSQYLDHEGFDRSMFIGSSTSGIKKYKHEGKTVSNVQMYLDGPKGFQNVGDSGFCGFVASSRSEWNYTVSSMRFYTHI